MQVKAYIDYDIKITIFSHFIFLNRALVCALIGDLCLQGQAFFLLSLEMLFGLLKTG